MGQNFAGSAAGDGCSNCGTGLAADQQYCLVCGERRGQARFAVGEHGRSQPAAPVLAPAGGRRMARASGSSGATLVAGIATLLLAMGVGVLIGRQNNNAAGRAPVSVVTVAGGAAAASTTASASTAAPTTTKHKHKAVSAIAGSQPATITTVKNLPPPKVQLGQAGHGPGYTNGKFTGNFFGQ